METRFLDQILKAHGNQHENLADWGVTRDWVSGVATANVQNEMTSRYVYRPAARELLR